MNDNVSDLDNTSEEDPDQNDFIMDIEEAHQILDEIKEEPSKDILPMTDVESLSLKNFNLQVILADKNIENLQLKQTILIHEKQEVLNQVKELKLKMQFDNGINIEDYAIDLPNKRLVHRKLLQPK
jgi:hypothetical protein